MRPAVLRTRARLALAICASILASPLLAQGVPVIDGTNLSQNIMTAIESVAQTLKQIEQYSTQLQQYQNQLQNTMAPAAYIWDQAQTTINRLIAAGLKRLEVTSFVHPKKVPQMADAEDVLAQIDKRPGVTLGGVLKNWGLVFAGNFAGAFTVAVLMAIVFTNGFSTPPDKVGQVIGHIGEGRTLGYAQYGAAGMLTLFVRGVLCNWMVSTGVVGAMISTTVTGKVVAMWMPIMVFFAMVFEHSVVNMFLFPSGLMLGGNFTIMDYLEWNEIPTALGNLVGGLAFTGLAMYATHSRTAPKRNVSVVQKEVPAGV